MSSSLLPKGIVGLFVALLPQASPHELPTGALYEMIIASDLVARVRVVDQKAVLERLSDEELEQVTDLSAIKSGILHELEIEEVFFDPKGALSISVTPPAQVAVYRPTDRMFPHPHAVELHAQYTVGQAYIWFAVVEESAQEFSGIYALDSSIRLYRSQAGTRGLRPVELVDEEVVRRLCSALAKSAPQARIEALQRLLSSENPRLREEANAALRALKNKSN